MTDLIELLTDCASGEYEAECEDGELMSFRGCRSRWDKSNAVVVRQLQFGDYNSTNTVERSNVRVALDELEDVPGVFHITGPYYWEGILFVFDELEKATDEQREQIFDMVSSLQNYPVLDENDLSELEMEIEQESWESWISGELHDEIEKRFDVEFDPDENEDAWYELYRELLERANEYPIFENPSSCYINVRRLAEKCEFLDLAPFNPEPLDEEAEEQLSNLRQAEEIRNLPSLF